MTLKSDTVLYVSPNGDAWSAGKDDAGRLWVMHVPNQSSGGQTSVLDAEAFLAHRQNYGPQHHALVQLLALEGDKSVDDRAARALGAAVIGAWADLPRDIQAALFEAAAQSESDEPFREQLEVFLHDRHARTVG